MVVKAVVFDVGETLVDETRAWEAAADACGVPRFTLIALVGAAIERGESHRCAFEWLEEVLATKATPKKRATKKAAAVPA